MTKQRFRVGVGGWIAGGLLMAVIASGPQAAQAAMIYTSGHGDIGIEYDGGSEFELHYHLGALAVVNGVPLASGMEFAPDELYVRVADPSIPRPAGAAYGFIGVAAGQPVWFLPQTSIAGKPFLGIASEELDPAEWSGSITWSLASVVSSPVGGQFSLWQESFGGPVPLWTTSDGISPADSFAALVGGHDHYTYGFTTPGVYELEIMASGTRAGTGQAVSGSGIYTFLVGDSTEPPNPVPEPGTMVIFGTGALSMFFARRFRGIRLLAGQGATA